jgi:hypothetical protein
MKKGSERIAGFRAIVRLMADGTRRISIRVDRNHVTTYHSDRKLLGGALEAIHDVTQRQFADALRDGYRVATDALARRTVAIDSARPASADDRTF